jgi:hypothetical protein
LKSGAAACASKSRGCGKAFPAFVLSGRSKNKIFPAAVRKNFTNRAGIATLYMLTGAGSAKKGGEKKNVSSASEEKTA